VIRVVQRSTVQFAVNSLLVIGLAAFVASRTGRAEDVFLPGIIWNAVAGAVLLISVLVRWPFLGLIIGSATGDLTGWRRSRRWCGCARSSLCSSSCRTSCGWPSSCRSTSRARWDGWPR
jgi:hypothetical protein